MTNEIITSSANAKIRHLKKLLADPAHRISCGEYMLEGARCLDSSTNIKMLIFSETFAGRNIFPEIPAIKVSQKVFKEIASTENTQGIAAVAGFLPGSVKNLKNTAKHLLLDRIQDPGNIGTIIRTSCAFGIKSIILTKGCTDPYAPKAARSSAGAVKDAQITRVGGIDELSGHIIIAAHVEGLSLNSFKWPHTGYILALGNEANGLSSEVLAAARHHVSIPLSGAVESLNAATAAAIMLFCSQNML